jgi:hypothetical protein
MPPKRPSFSAIALLVVAIAAVVVLFQMTRHRLQADDAVRRAGAGNAERLSPEACAALLANARPSGGAPAVQDSSSTVRLRMDYAGAEALINAVERDSLSDADVDSLLRIPGLCAMVANVGRFFPAIGVAKFRKDIRAFARTRKRGEYDGYFRLNDVWKARAAIRTLTAAIRANEPRITREALSQLERYRPDTGTLAITAYFVAGGVSDGFAFESDPRSFYANLLTAGGDLNGLVLNMAHEAYHVMQARAQEQAGVDPRWVVADTMPPVQRLFAGVLAEGTANYAADPTRWLATGPSMDSARQRYRRNAEPSRIARNFALFDAVLFGQRDGRVKWDKAYAEGFSSKNDASFYFVGYEMTRALEQHCGRECIAPLFREPPIEFFRRYIALYRQHPEIPGRFSQDTEGFIAAQGTRPTQSVTPPVESPPAVSPPVAADSDDVSTPRPKPEFHTPDRIAILPAPIRDTLVARKCRVPQYVGDTTSNVARGSFFGPSQMGWAVWCEVGGRSRILVFRDGVAGPDELHVAAAELPDNDPRPDASGFYCVGGVSPVAGEHLEAIVRHGQLAEVGEDAKLTAEERAAPLHDGIIDGGCDGASNVHYWTGKRWVRLPGGD